MDDRTTYIGGTDCAAILGLSRWKTPIEVWAEKTGKVEPEDISKKLQVRLGTRLEDAVAELFEEETGKKTHRVNLTLRHKEHGFLGANIDRRVVGEDALLECKTTSERRSGEWDGEEIPQEYILQCMHYLAVTGYERAYIAVLVGNRDFYHKEIGRDDVLISEIIKKEVHFWREFVEKDVMPMQVTGRDASILFKLFPKAEEKKEVVLDDEVNRIKESLDALKQDKGALESQIRKLENEVKARIRDNEIGKTGLWSVSWKNVHKDEYIVKEQNYRQLAWKKAKEG